MDENSHFPQHVLITAIYDLIESIQETFKKLMFGEGEHLHVAINNLLEVWLLFTRRVVGNPDKLTGLQTFFWQEYLLLCEELQERLAQNPAVVRNALLMGFIEKFYFLTLQQVQVVIEALFPGENDEARQQIVFYKRQFAEAFSLNNFINTNLEMVYAAMAAAKEDLN